MIFPLLIFFATKPFLGLDKDFFQDFLKSQNTRTITVKKKKKKKRKKFYINKKKFLVDIWKSIIANLMSSTQGIFNYAVKAHAKVADNVYMDIWRQLDFGYPFSYFQDNLYEQVSIVDGLDIDAIQRFIQKRFESAKEQLEYEINKK